MLPKYLQIFLYFSIKNAFADRKSMFDQNGEFLPHVRLAKDLVEKYDHRVRPVLNHSQPTIVNFTMSLYQILAINEKVQSVDLNLWVIQKWHDEFLGWNPEKYGGINDTILPHQKIWLPDTYLYNSMVMNREETERYINVVVSTEYWERRRGAQVMFMFPALYRFSCRINILYFPYDQQNCTLVISSWTSDMTSIDYQPDANSVNLHSFIRNEEWEVVSFQIRRVVQKFVCCPEPWVLLHASLVVRRKPLYYIVNLVLPTSVITLVAVTGFFTPASTSNERREKLSLGIDSLLAMSILMMMVSEQMPTTSDYVPLFGIFYLSIIMIIFTGTLITAFVLNVHLQKIYNKPIPPLVSYIFFHKMAPWLGVRPSTILLELWQETGVYIRGLSDKLVQKRGNLQRRKENNSSKRKAGRGSEKNMKRNSTMKSRNEDGGRNSLTVENNNNIPIQMRRGTSHRMRTIPQRIWRLSISNTVENKNRSIGEEDEDGNRMEELINPRSGLTPEQSIKARNNWRRIAQNANAKHRESMERGRNLLAVADGGQIPLDDEIPFADFSPGRLSLITTIQTIGEQLASPSGLSPRLMVPAPPPPTHKDLMAPTKCPPPIPKPQPSPGLVSSDSIPPALQLLILPQNSQKDPKVNAAAVLDLKLRRRFAYEWEFLATVLDRLLLIVFAGLVFFVTGAMIICGEIILNSYPNGPEEQEWGTNNGNE